MQLSRSVCGPYGPTGGCSDCKEDLSEQTVISICKLFRFMAVPVPVDAPAPDDEPE